MILERIQKENDIKELSDEELKILASEIRQFLRENLFGELSSNLMKFTCALIVAITLAVPAIKQKMAENKQRKAAR